MRLGKILRRWRAVEEVSLREMATRVGVSAATLSRLERGEQVDGRTLWRVLNWLVGEEDEK